MKGYVKHCAVYKHVTFIRFCISSAVILIESIENFRVVFDKGTNRRAASISIAFKIFHMLHHMGNIFRDNVSASGYRGLQLDRKRRKELQEWKIALGHREDDHEDPANYPTQSY